MDRFGGGPPRRGGFSRQAAVKALKESVQTGHKTGLPQNLLSLFDARPRLDHVQPIKKRPAKLPLTGLGAYLDSFASEGDPEYQPPRPATVPPDPRLFRNKEFPTQARIDTETFLEKKIRLVSWKAEEAHRLLKESARDFDPNKDPNIEGDPYKTLLVARLSYDVTDKKLQREMEEFGPIKKLSLIRDKKGKSRGYAFVEFERQKDMKEAYKAADGRKIEGRRILIDVERGRTVENWRPRRLGGGLGGEGRLPKPPKKPKYGLPVHMLPDALSGAAVSVAAMGAPAGPPMDDRRRDGGEDRNRSDRDRHERERAERERERSDRERYERDRARVDGGRDRDRDRERERPDRDRKREREPSPRREEKRGRREPGTLEDGEVRDERERERDRDRDRERDRRDRERERDRV